MYKSASVCLLLCAFSVVLADIPWPGLNFNCTQLNYPPPPAKNVRQLRFGNINAIMALGDSMSAGFAMQGIPPQDFEEWRGYVWSIGGAEDANTIATWLQASYNPNIEGMAMGNTWPLVPGAWLDGGVSHASVQDLPPQIDYLVSAMQTQYAGVIDFKNDWKLLTLFIGANNLCDACNPKDNRTQPAFFEDHLRAALKQIHQQIPRVFVNMMTIFNISGVWDAGMTSWYCEMLWDGITNHECGCLTTGVASDRLAMDVRAVQFNAISEKLASEFAALNDPEFTVVVQPGVSKLNVAEAGESYLSALDCFHPNLWANEAFAYSLWNNMQQPVGKKDTAPDLKNLRILCPTENTYIQ